MYQDVIEGWVYLAPEGRHVYGNEMLRRCLERKTEQINHNH